MEYPELENADLSIQNVENKFWPHPIKRKRYYINYKTNEMLINLGLKGKKLSILKKGITNQKVERSLPCRGEMKFNCNYPHASRVKQKDRLRILPSLPRQLVD